MFFKNPVITTGLVKDTGTTVDFWADKLTDKVRIKLKTIKTLIASENK